MLNVVVIATGPLFTLDEAKAQLRVDHDDDDAIIATYSDAAVSHVLQYCNLPSVPEGLLPGPAFKAAALLVLGDLYGNRDSEIDGTVTLTRTVRMLIDPYRWIRV
jgi:uncharacterized phage protein (predicted DNA packaging)